MKHLAILVLVAAGLAGCASSQPTNADGTAASADAMPPGKKKVCKRERSNRAGSRIHRTCEYVDIEPTDASQ